MTKAAIDLGSNTLLLLIADVTDGQITVLREEQRIPRLGKGVDSDGNLAESSMEKALQGFREYRKIIAEYGEIPVVVTATSASRDAANGKAFITTIKEETGFDVRILTGDEEAEATYKGALSMLDCDNESCGVVDIGGGSTELAVGKGLELHTFHSYDVGCVRFTERYLKTHPSTLSQIDICKESVKNTLESHELDFSQIDKLVGVAGTVTSLAYLVLGLKVYQPEKLNGMKLTLDDIIEWQLWLNSFEISELEEQWPVVMKGRADIFMAGLCILEEVVKKSEKDHLIVSTGGLRHGMLLS